MALTHEARPRAGAADPTLALPSRVIAVGIRDHEYDGATIRWAEHEALPGADAIHLVHAYVHDERALLSRRITEQAVQRVRAARPDVLVEGSTVQGLPMDVLHEFTAVVDLLVIGDDAPRADDQHRVAKRIQGHARCPVVTVPRGVEPTAARPVTVIVTATGTSDAALRFAADAATRHHVPLHVVDASTQRGDWLSAVATGSSLLVAARDALPALRALHSAARCPVAIVPNAE